MSILSREFLKEMAFKYALSAPQTEAFVERYSGDGSEQDAADRINISHSAFRGRMTGVYSKFCFDGKGPGKFYQLQVFLIKEQEVSSSTASTDASSAKSSSTDIDALVKLCRGQVKDLVQQRCGMMRVLDMSQPIGLGKIYTNVNILEKLTGSLRLDIAELMEDVKVEDFDRVGLGCVTQRRVPGLEAVRQYDKLMVLGKPGAGKTTFLKYLALQCNEGAFQAHCVPMFIPLKEFAEARNQPDLLTSMLELLADVSKDNFFALLCAGRVLLLLDGLDEVRVEDTHRVLGDIKALAERYSKSQFVITCRIAAKDYTLQQFTEVEVADFDERQIAEFAQKYFSLKHIAKTNQFVTQLKERKRIRKLATNPLLLTLLCLIFEEKGKFQNSRSELYEEGIELLLEKWDGSRDIERDPVYKKLSPKRKKELLSQIAFINFKENQYFFKLKTLEHPITDYIQTLPEVTNDSEVLLISSRKILRSIEAQHGLLVERSRNIYSFSQLTFQEYFTARYIVDNFPDVQQYLVENITEKRWREVFLLTAEMLNKADELLLSMKSQVDSLLIEDKKIQQFLAWLTEKSNTVEVSYSPAATRAFYFDLTLNCDRDFDLTRAVHFLPAHRLLDLTPDLLLDRTLDRTLDRGLTRIRTRAVNLDRFVNFHHPRDTDLACDFDETIEEQGFTDKYRACDRVLERGVERSLDQALSYNLGLALEQALLDLREQMPTTVLAIGHAKVSALEQWWQTLGPDWVEVLVAVTVEHRNIGHDWQFSDQQIEKLEQYYAANLLLVSCLNSNCCVTREAREEIESTLLLPPAADTVS
ncbi:MAG: NACHT domain-containing NTPase [Cyanobacteria bacterium P01_F01_bin.3]